MSVVHNIPKDGRPLPPGVWIDDDQLRFAIVPLHRPLDGLEVIPFSWASEYAPVGEFVLRFPKYWKADKFAEVWVGERADTNDIYWCRREQQIPGSA